MLLAALGLEIFAMMPELRACGNVLSIWLRGGAPQLASAPADPSLRDANNRDYVITRQSNVTQVVLFGYTHCSDECPTALSKMARAYDAIGRPSRLRLVFVSFDPDRDTPRVLSTYMRLFKAPIIGLSGSPPALRAAMRRFGVEAVRIPSEEPGEGYSFAHTTSIHVIGPNDSFEAMYPIEDMDVHQLVIALQRELW